MIKYHHSFFLLGLLLADYRYTCAALLKLTLWLRRPERNGNVKTCIIIQNNKSKMLIN